jgi:ubiquinone/menaquinone biosynthesis C-methylase UbiE
MEYRILEEMFKGENPGSVFEIGCANGGLLKDLKDHYPDLKVGGMDISNCIEKSRKEFGSENFYLGDVNDPWPIADKSFDIVFSVGVLMYMFDPLSVLREMLRVGKKVIIAEPHSTQAGLFGRLTKGAINNGKLQTGIERDYVELAKALNVPLKLNYYESSQGKWIFKLELA